MCFDTNPVQDTMISGVDPNPQLSQHSYFHTLNCNDVLYMLFTVK